MTLLTVGLSIIALTSGPNGGRPKVQGALWQQRYEAGLKAAKLGHWQEARKDFTDADHARAGDTDRATLGVGGPSEPTRWRDGAPYTPKFLIAYSDYRMALDSHDPTEQTADLTTASSEFEHLLSSGERSRDIYFFLDVIYARLNAQSKRDQLRIQHGRRANRANFKVDEDPLAPEEIAAIQSVDFSSSGETGTVKPGNSVTAPTIAAGSLTTGPAGQALNPLVPGLQLGGVAQVSNKYALIIGEDGAQGSQTVMPFASYDAGVLKDGLINYAGYEAGNVVTVQNGTAAQIMQQAKALAQKVTQDSVVLLFFAGPGVNVQGRDYFSASDTTSHFDTETMVAKSDLYQLFFLKGARLFSFYEVNRPIENGFFFGSEAPRIGAVSQMEATIPDAEVTATVANGHMVGLFAESFIQVLAELRSNQIPIYEFGWQLYNKMRRGNTGQQGGAGHQIPTLPVLNNLASDARF